MKDNNSLATEIQDAPASTARGGTAAASDGTARRQLRVRICKGCNQEIELDLCSNTCPFDSLPALERKGNVLIRVYNLVLLFVYEEVAADERTSCPNPQQTSIQPKKDV